MQEMNSEIGQFGIFFLNHEFVNICMTNALQTIESSVLNVDP